MPGGNCERSSCTLALTSSATRTVFTPDCRRTWIETTSSGGAYFRKSGPRTQPLRAVQIDTAHAVHGLNRAPDLFVGDLRQLAAAHRPAHEQCEDRVRLRILFGDNRRQGIAGQAVDSSGHFLANILLRAIDVA